MSQAYDLAFAFWSKLTTETARLEAGTALANTEVPYFLSNALWYPKRRTVAEAIRWYEQRDLPPAVIVTKGQEAFLASQGFRHDLSFALEPLEPTNAPQSHHVEQVGWAQARRIAEVLAQDYKQRAYTIAITKGLAKLLQEERMVTAFLAYEKPAVGTVVAFESEDSLTVMLRGGETGALLNRIQYEAERLGLKPQALKPFSDAGEGLERWVVAPH